MYSTKQVRMIGRSELSQCFFSMNGLPIPGNILMYYECH